MSDKPDWEEIRREYEAGGISIRALASKHGVIHTTLYMRARNWNRSVEQDFEQNIEQQKKLNSERNQLQLVKAESPSPANAVEGANLGIDSLVTYLKKHHKEMDLADHVKASNALSAYNKIVINAPPDDSEEAQEDLSGFTEEELLLYDELQKRAKRLA